MKRISPGRWLFTFAVFGGWSALTVYLANLARPSGALLPVLCGVAFTVPLISLFEWLVHGVLYHASVPGLRFIRIIHHAGHHTALFPPTKYVQTGGFPFMRFRKPYVPFQMATNAWDSRLTEWSQVGLHFAVGIPFILVPAWVWGGGAGPFFYSVLGTLAVISWLLAYVHGVIHTPGDRLVERMRWFQWLDRHHYIHHVDKTANINFLLPLCDLVIGTQKWALTPEEAAAFPSFEEAKPMARDIPPRLEEKAA